MRNKPELIETSVGEECPENTFSKEAQSSQACSEEARAVLGCSNCIHVVTAMSMQPRNAGGNSVCLMVLVDCAARVCSPDGGYAERPYLVGSQFFGGSARRAVRHFLFRDVMTGRARFLSELHFSSLLILDSVMGEASVARNQVSS